LVIGVQAGSRAGDSVRVALPTVHLWDGLAPLDGLLLVSDPGCSYQLR
jgi:hypothetical protein